MIAIIIHAIPNCLIHVKTKVKAQTRCHFQYIAMLSLLQMNPPYNSCTFASPVWGRTSQSHFSLSLSVDVLCQVTHCHVQWWHVSSLSTCCKVHITFFKASECGRWHTWFLSWAENQPLHIPWYLKIVPITLSTMGFVLVGFSNGDVT